MNYSDYYLWLESLVNDGNHSVLIRYLYEVEYRWQFTLDRNRAAGGLNLRSKYAYENSIDICDVGQGECSVLEMLISVSENMVDILNEDIGTWFWVLLTNLGLDQFTDRCFNEGEVNYILNTWLDRDYRSNGYGSLFPLSRYNGDCRNLDTWSQMNAWIAENYPHSNSWLYS